MFGNRKSASKPTSSKPATGKANPKGGSLLDRDEAKKLAINIYTLETCCKLGDHKWQERKAAIDEMSTKLSSGQASDPRGDVTVLALESLFKDSNFQVLSSVFGVSN